MLTTSRKIYCVCLFLYFFSLLLSGAQDSETKVSKKDLGWLKEVLDTTRDDIKKNYYDPRFHGLDVDARFQQAWERIQSAPSRNYAVSDIAGAVSALNDSHTIFVPPSRPYVHEYGWRMQAEGESDCFITAVRPGSDAEKKGVKPGDQVLSVAGYAAIREDVWKIRYVYGTLRPQPGLRLVLRTPEGATKQIDVMSDLRRRNGWKQLWEIEAASKSHKPRFVEYGQKAIVFRLPDFLFYPDEANKMLDQIRKHDALILDLRWNPGGYDEFLLRFLGGMFDHDINVAERIGRKPLHASVAKSRGAKAFEGKIVVLVDSESASAAEVFARVMQLKGRGIVVGDRSSGKVMESQMHSHEVDVDGMGKLFRFGVNITEADLIMADGKGLENIGVVPDERVVPTGTDLATGRDPALAHAAQLVGINISPEEAGKLLPFEWPTEY